MVRADVFEDFLCTGTAKTLRCAGSWSLMGEEVEAKGS